METFKNILQFIYDYWYLIGPLVYEVVVRCIPTVKDWTLINLLHKSLPDNRKGLQIVALMMLSSIGAIAQNNVDAKSLRLVNVADSTTVLPINCTLYYNQQSHKPRIYYNSAWHDLMRNGGGSVPVGSAYQIPFTNSGGTALTYAVSPNEFAYGNYNFTATTGNIGSLSGKMYLHKIMPDGFWSDFIINDNGSLVIDQFAKVNTPLSITNNRGNLNLLTGNTYSTIPNNINITAGTATSSSDVAGSVYIEGGTGTGGAFNGGVYLNKVKEINSTDNMLIQSGNSQLDMQGNYFGLYASIFEVYSNDELNLNSTTNTNLNATGNLNITATDINVTNALDNDDSIDELVVRDPSTGELKYRSASSIGGLTVAGVSTEIQTNDGAGNLGTSGVFVPGNSSLLFGSSSNASTVRSLQVVGSAPGIELQLVGKGSGHGGFNGVGIFPNGFRTLSFNAASNTTASIEIQPQGGSLGQGRDFSLIGGNANGTNSNGGNISIISGTKTGTGKDGNITIDALTGFLILSNIPTSATGLPTGAVYSNSGVLTLAP